MYETESVAAGIAKDAETGNSLKKAVNKVKAAATMSGDASKKAAAAATAATAKK